MGRREARPDPWGGGGGACQNRRGNKLGFRPRLLPGIALAMAVAPALGNAASGSDITALASQRQRLQAQVAGLGGNHDSTVAALLATQDRIADLRRQSAANAARLAELQRQRDGLTADIAATQAQVATDQADLGRVARAQYKAEDQTNLWQIMFSSDNLGQAINRVVASVSVANRAHLLI